jgi:N-acetylglutamate synthase-like GNAT family acetyltransferase
MGYKMANEVQLRTATKRDLEAINAVIEVAVMGWRLPERIKRLAPPSYRYTEVDYEHIEFVVAEIAHHGIVGVAGCEIADPGDVPGKQALLLHGLYVQPEMQHKGIGTKITASS